MILGPRTFGSQTRWPPSSSDCNWNPTSRYERELHPENNGLTARCTFMGNGLCNCHEKAAADLSCGKNICCSSAIPADSLQRERSLYSPQRSRRRRDTNILRKSEPYACKDWDA